MLIKFSSHIRAEVWLKNQPIDVIRKKFLQFGYACVYNLVNEFDCLKIYQDSVTRMHSGEISVSNWRHDLGTHQPQVIEGIENTGQIMWPQDRIPGLGNGPLHERGLILSKALLGSDIEFDFDMLIYKDPYTGGQKMSNEKTSFYPGQQGETPWHQDESYWPSGLCKLEDKSKLAKIFPGRTITIWMALDDINENNGCLWFVPGSHKKGLRKHRTAGQNSHVLTTDEISEVYNGQVHSVPLKPGSAVIWTGRTLHFAAGNKSNILRRTYITNYRPNNAINYERKSGFNHLRNGFDDFDPTTAGDVYLTSKPKYEKARSVALKNIKDKKIS